MELILDEWIVREVIDTLYMARTTFLGITGLDSPQEVEKKSANETAITRRISKAIDLIQQSEQSPVPNDLEEAAKAYALNTAEDSEQYSARYLGYKDGAKWQAEQLLKSSPLPEDTVLFNKGVEEGRRLERDEFEKNRLAACSNQTKEEYDRETDFALEIIKKEHRQPTFSDAINYGMQLQKEQDERIYREFFNERNQGDASFRDLLAYKEGHRDGMEEQKGQMMDEWLKDRDGCFWDGVNEGKKAMEEQMQEAVEGEVCGRVYDHINVRFADGICKFLEPKNISHIPADVSKYKIGDKVKIIIVKE